MIWPRSDLQLAGHVAPSLAKSQDSMRPGTGGTDSAVAVAFEASAVLSVGGVDAEGSSGVLLVEDGGELGPGGGFVVKKRALGTSKVLLEQLIARLRRSDCIMIVAAVGNVRDKLSDVHKNSSITRINCTVRISHFGPRVLHSSVCATLHDHDALRIATKSNELLVKDPKSPPGGNLPSKLKHMSS